MGNQQKRGDCSKINLLQTIDDIGNDQFEQFLNEDSFKEFCKARGLEIPSDRYEVKEIIDILNCDDIHELIVLYDN